MGYKWLDHHTLVLDTGEFAYDHPKIPVPAWQKNWPCTGFGQPVKRPEACLDDPDPKYAEWESLSGIQAYERPGFMFGAGINAPGGTTFGPAAASQCSQVPGGVLRCVMPQLGPQGLQTERGWPPEIGPEEEALLDQGCRPTGRRCGGTPRAPAQYWCCPGGPLATVVGVPVLTGGLGEEPGIIEKLKSRIGLFTILFGTGFVLAHFAAKGVKENPPQHFSAGIARRVGEYLDIDWKTSPFSVDQFRKGMDIELEHGTVDPRTQVTQDDPIVIGKIALAHLHEIPDYYDRLEKMESMP